jgi:class 3 adenylate cyclase/tetratricopeptide (TPR) repeat protein
MSATDQTDPRQTTKLEMAHVLFMDIVGYSKLPMDHQETVLHSLQVVVSTTSEFLRTQSSNEIIRLPTGDGMALVFFEDAEAAARCALEVGRALKSHPEIPLRMGLHSGPVYRVTDINANQNVAGGGINIAQRVMDCGDAGHILTSQSVADVLGQLSSWKDRLHDLGEAEVKHGVRVHLYNLYTNEAGNSALPKKVATSKPAAEAGLKPAQKSTRLRGKSATAATILVVGLAVGGWLFFSRKAHALTDRDTIVLADFTNTTGDPVFDGTLRQGLSVQLEQSPFLSIISDQQVRQTLQMMGQKPDAKLTPEIARELCQRMGSAAVLDGSIAQIGSQYLMTVKAVNCSSGESLASTEAQASDKNQVLDALGRTASEIRNKLGESLITIHKFDVPIEQATTPSLEAFKAFTLARRAQMNGDERSSIALGKRAIELDPYFAGAYQILARSYSVANNSDLAIQNEKRAYELRNRVSEREKLSIEAEYQLDVTGNLERAAEAYELLSATYSREPGSFFVLGMLSTRTGQYDKAIVQFRRALDLDPTKGAIYAALASAYQFANRREDARSAIEEARRQNGDAPMVHYWEYMFAFLQGNVDGMTEQVSWSVGKPGFEDVFLFLQARTAAYGGKLGKAREFSGRLIGSQKGSLETEAAAEEASEALREAVFGNSPKARREATAALAAVANRDVQPIAASALVFAGDTNRALSLANDLEKRFPEDTLINFCFVPTIRAAAEVNQANPMKAIETLRITVPLELGANYGFSLYPVYVRGQAYLAAKQGKQAADEFQKILDHPGIVLNEPIGALAHLQIGRAYAMQGDTAKAKAAYQDFLTLWKDADPDIPILKEAKAEYAKLQ